MPSENYGSCLPRRNGMVAWERCLLFRMYQKTRAAARLKSDANMYAWNTMNMLARTYCPSTL